MRAAALALLLAAGCFSPDFPEGIGCNPENRACPEGMACVDTAGGPVCVNEENAGDAGVDALPGAALRQRIAAGDGHSCAIDAGGRLLCWGNNGSEQLGAGAGPSRPLPPAEVTVAAGPWIEVSAGERHTCALREDGALWCFGENDNGQLGVDDGAARERLVPGVWREVAAGGGHTCAIDDGGTLLCWGFNSDGQAGVMPGTDVRAPVALPGGPWRDVSAGYYHTCALDTSDHLYCWGYDELGQLGDGADTTSTHLPQAVRPDLAWSQIAAGGAHTCGLSEGRLFCWGSGNGVGIGDYQSSDVPAQVGSDADWTWVGAGNFHTCAVRGAAEDRYCFGENAFGQLGDGTTMWRGAPGAEPDDAGWAQLDGGSFHTCGLQRSGAVVCWGSNEFGQTGDRPAQSFAPVEPMGLSGTWTAISAGGDYSSAHTCAIVTGQLWCWGANEHGQLGIGMAPDRRHVPVPVRVAPSLAVTWDDVETGAYHTCARAGTALYCWGKNDHRQTGLDREGDIGLPMQVAGAWADFAAGGHHTCALTTAQELHCWGQNEQGQLGLGTISFRELPTRVPRPGGASTGAWGPRVFAGGHHTCALFDDGVDYDEIWCWGKNEKGQAGSNLAADQPSPVPLSWGPDDADGGLDHTCMTHFGTILCWGSNDSGQLGNPSAATPTPGALDLAPGVRVTGGLEHTCAIVDDDVTRDLWCWGSNLFGQLGYDEPRTGGFDPAMVDLGGQTVEDVSAGALHTCVILRNGTGTSTSARCFGSNAFGQLGDGRAFQIRPQMVDLQP